MYFILALYLGFKFHMKSKIVSLDDINLIDEFNKMAAERESMPEKDKSQRGFFSRVYHAVF